MAVEAAYAFWHEVDRVAGAFHDAVHGFQAHLERVNRGLQRTPHARIVLPPGSSRDDTNDSIAYWTTAADGEQTLRHAVPVPIFRARNRRDGPNTLVMGAVCVVSIYSFWEHRYRAAIATEVGCGTDQVSVPIMGDIRLLRNAIVHADGVMGESAKQLEVVDWLALGDSVQIDESRFTWLMEKVLAFVHSADTLRETP